MAQGDVASQQITQIEEQPDHSVRDELEGGARPLNSIEEVLNMTDEGECWILGSIVSVESGVHDWCYLACNNCPKKVIEVKNGYKCKKCFRILADPPVRYKLNIIVADGTGCLNLIVWNQEGKLILGKSANEVRALL
ncbi:hypothetical protein PIB30_112644, partial [Stylosanthes scabra]|nr:hypothetical protein [Stylosanthes scabra]